MNESTPRQRSEVVYRDRNAALRLELDEARRKLQTQLTSERWRERRNVLAKRSARAAAGLVGEIGGGMMLAWGFVAGAMMWFKPSFARPDVLEKFPHVSGGLFLGSLAAASLTYFLSRAVAHWRFGSAARLLKREPADAERAAIWFRERRPQRQLLKRLRRLEQPALMRPLGAVALLGPLAVHALVYCLFRLFRIAHGAELITHFAWWISFSSLIVGHAHWVSRWLMRDAVKRELGVDSAVPATYPVGRIVGWTTLAAAVPGVVLLALPPLLTAVTALVVMFPAHRWLRSTVDAERQTMPQRGGEFAAGADLEAVAEDSATMSHDPSALRIEPNETNGAFAEQSEQRAIENALAEQQAAQEVIAEQESASEQAR